MADSENTTRSLLTYVLDMTEEDVDRELDRVTRERQRLEAEEAFLDAARMLIRSRNPSARARNPVDDARVETPTGTRVIEAKTNLGSPSRQLVLAIIRTEPNRLWSPLEVYDALRERGYDAKRDSVRVMLQRLQKADLIDRPEPGQYTAFLNLDDGLSGSGAVRNKE